MVAVKDLNIRNWGVLLEGLLGDGWLDLPAPRSAGMDFGMGLASSRGAAGRVCVSPCAGRAGAPAQLSLCGSGDFPKPAQNVSELERSGREKALLLLGEVTVAHRTEVSLPLHSNVPFKVHEHSVRPNCSVGLFRGIFRLKRVWLYSGFTLTPVLRQQWNDAALLPSRQQNKTSFCSVEQRKSSQIVLQWQQIPTNMVQMQTEVSAGKDDWDEQGQTASHACRTMELPGGTSPSHSVQCTGTVLSFFIPHFPGLLRNLSLLYHAMTTILSTFKRLCTILKSQMNR